jgi:hypothetical protein
MFESSREYISGGFELEIVYLNFSYFILKYTDQNGNLQNVPSGTGGSSGTKSVIWREGDYYSSFVGGVYTVMYSVYDNAAKIGTVNVSYVIDGKNVSVIQQNFDLLYNETANTALTYQYANVFYPGDGITLPITVLNPAGNWVETKIKIPPLPIHMLFIEDTLVYDTITDSYVGPGETVTPDTMLMVTVREFFYENHFASGVSVDLKRMSDGKIIRYNPRIKGSRSAPAPFIYVPVILNPKSALYPGIVSGASQIHILTSETGDGVKGFRKEFPEYYMDNSRLILKINHLTDFGVTAESKTSLPKDSGGGDDDDDDDSCFISAAQNTGDVFHGRAGIILILTAFVSGLCFIIGKRRFYL